MTANNPNALSTPTSLTAEQELGCLKDILTVAQVVISSLDLDEVLQNILFSAMGIMDMPAGSIALYDEESSRLQLHAHAGLSEVFVAKTRWLVKPGGLTHRIIEEGELFIVNDTQDAVFFNNPLAVGEGIRSLIAMPLKIQSKIIGILYLDDFEPRTFDDLRLRMLAVLGAFATMSIDNARLHEKTRQLACTDGLTGLFNHRQFMAMFRDEQARTIRYGKPLSLVMFDIDDFKKFNDSYGHPCGDRVLIVVAEILRDCMRGCDHSFRYGGEEFICLLPETDFDRALIVAERVRAMIAEETPARLQGCAPHGVTVSVGVASYPRDGQGEALLKEVDDQLYRAKREGKNRVYYRSNQ